MLNRYIWTTRRHSPKDNLDPTINGSEGLNLLSTIRSPYLKIIDQKKPLTRKNLRNYRRSELLNDLNAEIIINTSMVGLKSDNQALETYGHESIDHLPFGVKLHRQVDAGGKYDGQKANKGKGSREDEYDRYATGTTFFPLTGDAKDRKCLGNTVMVNHERVFLNKVVTDL